MIMVRLQEFKYFARLPKELKLMVWEFAMPSTVNGVVIRRHKPEFQFLVEVDRICTSPAVPRRQDRFEAEVPNLRARETPGPRGVVSR